MERKTWNRFLRSEWWTQNLHSVLSYFWSHRESFYTKFFLICWINLSPQMYVNSIFTMGKRANPRTTLFPPPPPNLKSLTPYTQEFPELLRGYHISALAVQGYYGPHRKPEHLQNKFRRPVLSLPVGWGSPPLTPSEKKKSRTGETIGWLIDEGLEKLSSDLSIWSFKKKLRADTCRAKFEFYEIFCFQFFYEKWPPRSLRERERERWWKRLKGMQEWMTEWINELINEWMHEWLDGQMNEWMNELIN